MDDLIKKYRDQLPGGRGDGRRPDEFDIEALRKGIKVEMEHTSDPMLALEITIDHLSEDEEYYDKLETIDPHDDEGKADHKSDVIKKKDKAHRFITGDDIIAIMSTIAEELFDRGSNDLAGEVTNFVAEFANRR